ncbi:MAG: DUF1987 domain-containing protein [Dysgonamonadaceae bacterium]|jgi:hypothetical protein|nr:DUF1987 domain-containing protein [Dysgonamonadaceae bacterium]
MENIRIEKTAKSPLIVMKTGYIGMKGRSIPQNSKQLYKPCFEWVAAYIQHPAPLTIVEIFFEYVDTSSIRCVVDLLSLLESNLKKEKIEVVWYYEQYDDDLHELGTYIQTFIKVPFKYVMVAEDQEINM